MLESVMPTLARARSMTSARYLRTISRIDLIAGLVSSLNQPDPKKGSEPNGANLSEESSATI
jgi:hypothetical protein